MERNVLHCNMRSGKRFIASDGTGCHHEKYSGPPCATPSHPGQRNCSLALHPSLFASPASQSAHPPAPLTVQASFAREVQISRILAKAKPSKQLPRRRHAGSCSILPSHCASTWSPFNYLAIVNAPELLQVPRETSASFECEGREKRGKKEREIKDKT